MQHTKRQSSNQSTINQSSIGGGPAAGGEALRSGASCNDGAVSNALDNILSIASMGPDMQFPFSFRMFFDMPPNCWGFAGPPGFSNPKTKVLCMLAPTLAGDLLAHRGYGSFLVCPQAAFGFRARLHPKLTPTWANNSHSNRSPSFPHPPASTIHCLADSMLSCGLGLCARPAPEKSRSIANKLTNRATIKSHLVLRQPDSQNRRKPEDTILGSECLWGRH